MQNWDESSLEYIITPIRLIPGHGLFTYALLQGVEGKADGSPKDDKVTVSELNGYVQDQLPELSKRYYGQPQYPAVYMRGQDFPVSVR